MYWVVPMSLLSGLIIIPYSGIMEVIFIRKLSCHPKRSDSVPLLREAKAVHFLCPSPLSSESRSPWKSLCILSPCHHGGNLWAEECLHTDPFSHRKILLAQDLREIHTEFFSFLKYFLRGFLPPCRPSTPLPPMSSCLDNKSTMLNLGSGISLTKSIT